MKVSYSRLSSSRSQQRAAIARSAATSLALDGDQVEPGVGQRSADVGDPVEQTVRGDPGRRGERSEAEPGDVAAQLFPRRPVTLRDRVDHHRPLAGPRLGFGAEDPLPPVGEQLQRLLGQRVDRLTALPPRGQPTLFPHPGRHHPHRRRRDIELLTQRDQRLQPDLAATSPDIVAQQIKDVGTRLGSGHPPDPQPDRRSVLQGRLHRGYGFKTTLMQLSCFPAKISNALSKSENGMTCVRSGLTSSLPFSTSPIRNGMLA